MSMNTRKIAAEYRLAHWTQIMRRKKESGLSAKAFCENEGIHENVYYYWQQKLREATCEQMAEMQNEQVQKKLYRTQIRLENDPIQIFSS